MDDSHPENSHPNKFQMKNSNRTFFIYQTSTRKQKDNLDFSYKLQNLQKVSQNDYFELSVTITQEWLKQIILDMNMMNKW